MAAPDGCPTLIGILLLLGVSACVDPCGNQVLAETPSPGGRFKAVVLQHDGGATTGFSTQVSLIPSGDKVVTRSGNAFVADTNRGEAPSGPGGGLVVEVE